MEGDDAVQESLDVDHFITTEQQLRDIVGYPRDVVLKKEINKLDIHCQQFIAQSPFLVIASSNEAGECDVSPRGDAPGFVLTLDNRYLIIPERPGNRRVDTMRNILTNPQVSIIFIIPGLEETLRIKGRAFITNDPELLEQMKVKNKVPAVAIAIDVQSCFIHCAKAFKRSHLWKPQAWLNREQLPNVSKMLADHINMAEVDEEAVNQLLHESYTKRLY